MDRKVYVITNEENDYSKVVALTDDQVRAIDWFIEMADLDYSFKEATVENVKSI